MIRVRLFKMNETGIGEYLIGGYAKTKDDIKEECDRLRQRAKQYYGATNIYFIED